MSKRDEVLFVRMPSDLKDAVDLLAEQNERSLSQQVRILLRREVERSCVGEKQ
jgi:predicted transcriptional regulator